MSKRKTCSTDSDDAVDKTIKRQQLSTSEMRLTHSQSRYRFMTEALQAECDDIAQRNKSLEEENKTLLVQVQLQQKCDLELARRHAEMTKLLHDKDTALAAKQITVNSLSKQLKTTDHVHRQACHKAQQALQALQKKCDEHKMSFNSVKERLGKADAEVRRCHEELKKYKTINEKLCKADAEVQRCHTLLKRHQGQLQMQHRQLKSRDAKIARLKTLLRI